MRDRNSNATKKATDVRCLEVLISKRFIAGSQNLLWTLSVYSLENQPVSKDRALHNSEVFHFMVFDWERTIRHLLDRNKVPYTVIQFFTFDSLFSETCRPEPQLEVDETHYLSAVIKLEDTDLYTMSSLPRQRSRDKETVDSNL